MHPDQNETKNELMEMARHKAKLVAQNLYMQILESQSPQCQLNIK